MSVYKEKRDGKLTGRWLAAVTYKGERKRQRFDTHLEAVEAETKWKADFYSLESSSKVTLASDDGTSVPEYLSQLRTRVMRRVWAGKGDEQMTRIRSKEIVTMLGNPRIKSINFNHVEELMDFWATKGNSNSTINRKLSVLHKMLSYAADPRRNWIDSVPPFDWLKESGQRIRWIDKAEEQRIYECFHDLGDPWMAKYVMVGIDTGFRPSEQQGAKPDQLTGSDNQWFVHLWETKNHKPRTIPLIDRSHDALKSLYTDEDTPFFYIKDKREINHRWNVMRDQLGLSDDQYFVPYCLRHTCATRLVKARINLKVIKDWMGHKDIQTTLRYAHLDDEMLVEAAVDINKMFGDIRL
tara:strand:+ start:1204 stop:2262 length:1059 start_codon:yes stop_codon:yes gene_type:complete